MQIADYTIAGCRFTLQGRVAEVVASYLPSFEVFLSPTDSSQGVLADISDNYTPIAEEFTSLTTFDFEEDMAECVFSRSANYYMLQINGSDGCNVVLVSDLDVKHITTPVAEDVTPDYVTFLRFGLWFMMGMAMALQGVSAVHSSTVVCHDEAVMFLGESGTGKSTHTRLWLKHIEGARLLNDDSPFVFADDAGVQVCGSPWSGKTPCYKNQQHKLRGVVRLSQAPHNKISRLSRIMAIGALLPSLPPAFMFDKVLEDALLAVLSKVIAQVPVYHLECLPDAAAAQLSYKTIFGDD
jgi:hypothetical protein